MYIAESLKTIPSQMGLEVVCSGVCHLSFKYRSIRPIRGSHPLTRVVTQFSLHLPKLSESIRMAETASATPDRVRHVVTNYLGGALRGTNLPRASTPDLHAP